MENTSFVKTMTLVDKKFRFIQRIIMIGAFGFIITAITAGVTLRYFFRRDLRGIEEFITIAAFWMYFTGAIFATHSRQHIGAEIFSEFCKNKKILYMVAVGSSLLTVLICLLYSIWGVQMFHWSLTMKAATPVWRIPIVVGHTSILFSFIFMTIYWIYIFYQDHIHHSKQINKDESNG